MMIRRIDKDDSVVIRLTGHAGACDGTNVCNMISTLFATAYNVLNATGLGRAVRDVEESDWLIFDRTSEGLALAYAFCLGFDMVAEKYPKNVTFQAINHMSKDYVWDNYYTRRIKP